MVCFYGMHGMEKARQGPYVARDPENAAGAAVLRPSPRRSGALVRVAALLSLLAAPVAVRAHGVLAAIGGPFAGATDRVTLTTALWGVVAGLAAILAAALWTRALRRRVAARTRGLNTELAEVRTAREALRASEERLALALEASQTCTWLWDVPGRRMIWDDRMEELLGLPAGTLGESAEDALEHIHPDDREAVRAYFADCLRTGERFDIDTRIVRPDGSLRHVAMRGRVVRQPDGRAESVTGVAQDVTGTKRSEDELARLSTAIRQASEAVVITDAKGVIEYVNPAFEAMTGYPPGEALGNTMRLLKSGMHDDGFYAEMWERISAGDPWHGHVINRRRDGSLYEEETSIAPVRDSSGRIVNYVALKRDVTREVAMQAHLRQQQKLETLGLIASSVAHEINNPLTGVLNYAQLIVDGAPQASEAGEFGREIVREADRMADMVRGMLSFAKRSSGELAPGRITDIVRATRMLVRAILRNDQITLATDIPDDLPQVMCRVQEIEQVVLNLLTNARDALNAKYPARHEDKVIRVTASTIGDGDSLRVRTTVEDHGAGIAAGDQQRIFEPFFTTKGHALGTGLGLAICADIVRDHGGALTVESQPGGPTRFHLDLPPAPGTAG
jgi:PAS domain S-box-containing protein